ncbi:MAG: TonB-dependent receptor [Muribaculaceae bacterium]|nr:TonB-dependent receptor [Muribaculaceae bacterium]
MIRKYISILILGTLISTASAQQNTTTQQGGQELHKEITLEKDFVPEVKKATKKNALPKVKKIDVPARTSVSYSDWANPIDVPTTIPTMMPYGYRTAHNFSDKRGYLDVGGGMAANFVGSAGYRIIDTDKTTLGAWLQHNSTWAGKNSTKYITDDSQRLKQQFNDNKLGLNLDHRIGTGTLSLSAMGHFDSFNYYGATNESWADANKQTFTEFGIKAGWDGEVDLKEHTLSYGVGLSLNHAGYDKALLNYMKAAKENVFNFTLGAEYQINNDISAGLEFEGDYVNTRLTSGNRNYFLLTASPYLLWENHAVRAQLGADILLGKPQLYDFSGDFANGIDNKKVHVSPNVKLDFNLADGAAFYIDISGGKILNTLSNLAIMNRYSAPWGGTLNTFSPFDGEAGFKIGPFAGFSMRVFAGYGFFNNDINAVVPNILFNGSNQEQLNYLVADNSMPIANNYAGLKARGIYLGGELNYSYRSIVDAHAGIKYAPSDDDVNSTGWNNSYPLDGIDGACLVGNFDLKIKPIRKLTIDLGLELRSQRSVLEYTPNYIPDPNMLDDYVINNSSEYQWFDLDDVINLHAGASWRFDKVVSLWVKGNNLLNRKWDVMPGMGAQKLNIMAGVGLVF